MPKIGKYFYRHDTGNIVLEYEILFGCMKHSDDVPYEVYKAKHFYIRLPEALITYYKKRVVYSKNHDDLVAQFDKMARNYYSKSVTKEKVISLKFDWNRFLDVEELENEDRYNSQLSIRDHYNQVPEIRFSMQYEIGYIVTIGTRKFFSVGESDTLNDIDVDDNHSRRRSYDESKFIPWSSEREAWVDNTYNSFNEMINKCREFYEQKEEDITKKIDTVGLRLLNNE